MDNFSFEKKYFDEANEKFDDFIISCSDKQASAEEKVYSHKRRRTEFIDREPDPQKVTAFLKVVEYADRFAKLTASNISCDIRKNIGIIKIENNEIALSESFDGREKIMLVKLISHSSFYSTSPTSGGLLNMTFSFEL